MADLVEAGHGGEAKRGTAVRGLLLCGLQLRSVAAVAALGRSRGRGCLGVCRVVCGRWGWLRDVLLLGSKEKKRSNRRVEQLRFEEKGLLAGQLGKP